MVAVLHRGYGPAFPVTRPEPAVHTLPPNRRPGLAAALQLVPLLGGLGYLYLGQRVKALRSFVVVALLVGANVYAAAVDWRGLSMALGPAVLIVQVLTGLDAWILARAARAGEDVGPRSTRVPVLGRWVG